MSDDLVKVLLESMRAGKQRAGRDRQRRYLGFASEREEKVFRAIAVAYPKAVLIADRDWKRAAEEHRHAGLMSCTVRAGGDAYRLTDRGLRRAKSEKLIRAR